MPNESNIIEEHLRIVIDPSTYSEINKISESVREMREDFSEMPHLGEMLNSSLERTSTLTDTVNRKLQKASDITFNSQDDKDRFSANANASVEDLRIMHKLQTTNDDFNPTVVRSWAKGLSSALSKELDAIIPDLAGIFRSRMSPLTTTGNSAYKNTFQEVAGLSQAMFQDKSVQQLLKSKVTQSYSDDVIKQLLRVVVANSSPMMRLDDYTNLRYNSNVRENAKAAELNSPLALLPASFQSSFKNKGYLTREEDANEQRKWLTSSAYKVIQKLLAENPVAVNAAVRSGIARRDDRGVLELQRNISRKDYDDLRRSIYGEFTARATGAGEYRVADIYTDDPAAAKIVAGRMAGSSSAGNVIRAMQQLEALESAEAWMDRQRQGSAYIKQPKEPKRVLDQYSILSFAPFDSTKRPQKEVSITESNNTRLLGLQSRGYNGDASDTIATISLSGYDKNNEAHVAELRKLFEEGKEIQSIGGKIVRMRVQSMHRGDDGAILRLVEESAMAAVDERLRPIAEAAGLSGSYWTNYQNTDKFDDLVHYRKHLDARNKGWTPSADLGLNLDGKKIAVVAMSTVDGNHKTELADGTGWLSEGILPTPIQFRGGVSGKGTLRPLPGETNRDFAIRSGLATQDQDGQWHWYVQGANPNDAPIDIIDYNGFVDKSVIKNMSAYRNADGTLKTSEEINDTFMEMLRISPLSVVKDFSKMDSESDRIGVQMMSFMDISPELQMRQQKQLSKRLQELDTEEGMLKYVFPASNEDYLSTQVNDPEKRWLLQGTEAQKRVALYREELMRKAMSGEWIDFGDDPNDTISNVELAGSPLAAFFRMNGINDDVRKIAREALTKEFGKEYSDQEIDDILKLRGTKRNADGTIEYGYGIDFGRADQEELGFLRSPTGYGNMVVARNVAKEVQAIYAALAGNIPEGMDSSMFSKDFLEAGGVILAPEDLKTLSGADLDADTVKTVTGSLKDAVKSTIEHTVTMPEKYTQLQITKRTRDGVVSDSTEERIDAVDDLTYEPLGMGTYSAAIRGMQFDPTNPEYIDRIRGFHKGQVGYDATTTIFKDPKEIARDKDIDKAVAAGKEYTRFTQNVKDIFSLDEDMYDDKGNILDAHKDMYRASNGTVINMRKLKELDLLHTNLPSVYMDNHVLGLASMGRQYREGRVDTTRFDAMAEALSNMSNYDQELYGSAGTQTKTLIDAVNQLYPQFGTGKRTKLTVDETKQLRELYDSSLSEIVQQAMEQEVSPGRVLNNEGKQVNTDWLVRNLKKKYGLTRVENALKEFGFTDDRLSVGLPESLQEFFVNSADAKLNIAKAPQVNATAIAANAPQIVEQLNKAKEEAAAEINKLEQEKAELDEKLFGKEVAGGILSASMTQEEHDQAENRRSEINRLIEAKQNEYQNTDAMQRQAIEWYKDQVEFESVFANAREFNSGLWKSRLSKEAHIEDKSKADLYYNKQHGIANYHATMLDDLIKRTGLSGEQKESLIKLRSDILSGVDIDFADKSVSSAKRLFENLDDIVKKIDPKYNKTRAKIDEYNEEINDLEKFRDLSLDEAEKSSDSSRIKTYLDSAVETDEYIVKTREKLKELQNLFGEENAKTINNIIQQFSFDSSDDPFAKLFKNAKRFSDQIEQIKNQFSDGILPDDFDKDSAFAELDAQKVVQYKKTLESGLDAIKQSYDSVREIESKYDGTYDSQTITLKKIDEEIANIEAKEKSLMLQMSSLASEDKISLYDGRYSATRDAMRETHDILSQLKESRANVASLIQKENDRYFESSIQATELKLKPEDIVKNIEYRAKTETDRIEQQQALMDLRYRNGNVSQDVYDDVTARNIDLLDYASFERFSSDYVSKTSKSIFQAYDVAEGNYSKAAEALKQYNEIIVAHIKIRDQLLEDGKKQDANKIQQIIDQEQAALPAIQKYTREQNQKRYSSEIDSLSRSLGSRDPLSRLRYQSEDYQKRIDDLRISLATDFKLGDINEADYNSNLKKLNELEEATSITRLGLKEFVDSVNRVFMQFGRQMFHKAINETKQFVTTYDAAMTEIQMVTLKTDEEIATLGDGLIDKAIDLKVSVGDVTTAATALYRQGLSDAQVDDRLEDITKFAKTAKVKTDDAIKLITVAMNSEMVKSSDQAMDVISALSDSAATEAAQITKGLQKSMSAAKEVGVTYKELVAMLTVITSKTQLSGSVAGTTMRNLLSRLVRVNQDDLIVDESGVAISASQQARVLNSLGLQIYNRADGSIDAYNTLSQVGSMWNDLSDAERNQVAFVLGGSEQFSNVAALMQGFAETDENGQNLLQKYLSIAEGSTGITDEKYAHYLDSLAASMDGFASSFDAMIKSATDSAPVVAFFNFLTGSISGLTALNEELNAVPSTLVLIGGAMAALMAMAQPLRIAFGVIAGVAALGSGINSIREANPQTTSAQRLADASKAFTSDRNSTRALHEEAKKLNEQRNERALSADELVDLKQMLFELESLGHISLDAGESIDSLATSAEETSVALLHAAQSIEQYDAAQASRLIHDAAKSIDQDLATQREDNVGWERETLTQDDIDVINQHTGGDPSKLVGWSISGLGLPAVGVPTDNSLFDAVRNLYADAENSGYLDNQLTVYEEQKEGGAFGLGGKIVRTPIPWRELSDDEKSLYLQRNNIDLFTAMLQYANSPRAAANMNTPNVSFGGEQEQKLRSVLTASTLPGLASDKMLELLIVEVIKAMNEGLNADPENFSVDQWIHENLSDEYGQVSEDVAKAWLEQRNPQATEAAVALSTPFGRLASIADNATLMNKAGADMISPELYKMMLSAEGATYAEKMNSLATAFMEKEYAEAYLQNKDNADVAAVFKNAAAIDKDGKLTGEVSSSFGEEEWFTLMQLLSSKTSQLAMAGFRSDAAQRNSAYSSLETILNSANPLEAYRTLSVDETTNKRLQDELGRYVDEELLNILLSGEASDDTKAYVKRQIKYGDNVSDTFKDRTYFDTALSQLLGAEYEDGLTAEEWSTVPQQYAELLKSPMGSQFLTDILQLDGGVDLLMELAEALENGEVNGEKLADALKHIVDQMNADDLAKMTKYKKNASEIAKIQSDIAKGGKDAAVAVLDMNEKVKDFNNIKWAVNQFKVGNRSSKVVDTIAEYFGGDLDTKELKTTFGDQAEDYVNLFEASLRDAEVQLVDEIDQGTNDLFAKANAEMLATTGQDIFDIGNIKIGGVVDISALDNAMAGATGDWSQIFLANVKRMAEASATLTSRFDEKTDQVILGWDLSGANVGSGYRGSYGGGGGSKKTSGDKLIEKQGYGQDLFDHQIKMVQYEQTKYENADELGNYGKMLEEEIKIERAYLPVLQSNIAALRSELANVKEGSEDWYKLRDAILEAEEKYSDINNTIAENEKKLKENHQAILKLHTDLEEMVVGEIELRIDTEKEMLDGSVSMQDTILNAIKDRYRDEWDLIKQDIEKKKEALQQEKDLIDERLDARRDAEDEAAKYEELAELKKQLSLISMDSTRTKDAAALRESIAELEKEIGWDIAEKEAENEKNAIQDQIDAYDDYITKGDEDLETLLEDANNFSEEVNGVLKLSQSELFEWLKQNVKEYANSLDDAQKQMVQSWEATYKQMLGITDTYWDEVNAILSSKDTFLNYMKQSNEYIYASDDERAQLLYQWEEAYDKWQKSQKNDADYSHGDSGLGNYSGSEYTGSSSSSGSSGGSSISNTTNNQYTGTPNESGWASSQYSENNYRVEGSTTDGRPLLSYNDSLETAKAAAASTSKSTGKPVSIYSPDGKLMYKYINGQAIAYGTTAQASGASGNSNAHWKYIISYNGNTNYYSKDGFTSQSAAQTAGSQYIKDHKLSGAKYRTKYYALGGIADYTGLAWLDGTKERPERILSAQQTEDFDELVSIMDDLRSSGITTDLIRDMMNWSTMINVPSQLSYIGNDAYRGNIANIGDIHVTVQEAQINDDRDIDDLAEIVGQKFVKEISKQGFNIAHYNF